MRMSQGKRIILLGMKHTGKSTLGALLADRLGVPFYDTDTVIAELAGKTPRELYDEGGAPLMALHETGACRHLAALPRDTGMVIATGGGISDNEEALGILKKTGLCVFLDTPEDIIFGRIMASARRDGRLPRFLEGPDPREIFHELFAHRSRTYATMADVRIATGSRKPDELAKEITDYIEHEQRTHIHS